MDYLFHIIFISYNCLRLFPSDAWMGTYILIVYLFQILMNSSQTVKYCDVLYWNLLYVVCLVYMCVGGGWGESGLLRRYGIWSESGVFGSLEQRYIFSIEYWKIRGLNLPFVLHVLYGVRAPFTIHVPLTILGSCWMIDCLFQIIFYG